MKPIKALLLSAGLGTRLRPLTYNLPKCLVEVSGEPILGRWIKELQRVGCNEVLINTHYMADKVNSYLSKWKDESINIKVVYEKELLGTAGTLIKNKSFFENSTCLFIHSDNMIDIDLNEFIISHTNRLKNCEITMLTFKAEDPKKCGIVEIDKNGLLLDFHEKVDKPPGDLANAAIYAIESELIEKISSSYPNAKDFSIDIIPKLLGHIYTCYTEKKLIDIGSPERLSKAKKIWGAKKNI